MFKKNHLNLKQALFRMWYRVKVRSFTDCINRTYYQKWP